MFPHTRRCVQTLIRDLTVTKGAWKKDAGRSGGCERSRNRVYVYIRVCVCVFPVYKCTSTVLLLPRERRKGDEAGWSSLFLLRVAAVVTRDTRRLTRVEKMLRSISRLLRESSKLAPFFLAATAAKSFFSEKDSPIVGRLMTMMIRRSSVESTVESTGLCFDLVPLFTLPSRHSVVFRWFFFSFDRARLNHA